MSKIDDAIINVDADLYIDESALDFEWLDHVNRAWKYDKLARQSEHITKVLEEKIKLKRSKIINEVNKDPKKYTNKDKPNASDIEAVYRTNPEYIKAKMKWVKALRVSNLLSDVVWKFNQRKSSLEGLLTLLNLGYNAGPKMPRDLVKISQQKTIEMSRRADEKVATNMNRKGNENG